METKDIYARFQLCHSLSKTMCCFRVRVRVGTSYEERLHLHLPAHRTSSESRREYLRYLVAKHDNWTDEVVGKALQNRRLGGHAKIFDWRYHHEYPEEGVERLYVSCGDVSAWYDFIVQPSAFRPTVP
jgi:hypothetical protein